MRELIAPSILSADFTRLGEECEAVLEAGADWLHVDVMDGRFVPNISIGLPVVRSLRQRFPTAYLDVHLMIEDPDTYGAAFAEAGASMVGFHPEATHHPHRVIQQIREAGAGACLVLNPGTPLAVLDHLVGDLDMILLMSVNPGFGGQAFIESTIPKLEALRRKLEEAGRPDLDVEIDGGVSPRNIGRIRRAGANIFVAGSAIFKAPGGYREAIDSMRRELAQVAEE